MSRRALIIVTCVFVLSLCASYLVYRAVGTRVAPGQPRETAQLVVAAKDLVVGTLIHDSDLRTASWFGPPPTGTTFKHEAFLNRGVVSTIYDGEPVTENRLAPKGSGGGLAAMIPPGMRACAVKVNEVVGVAGFVVPGMRVDVLISGQPPGGNAFDGPKVRTLLQNIQVLSAGTNFQKDREGKPEQAQVVNLLVSPAEAEVLSLASNETHIQLVLRNPMDTQVTGLPGTIMSDLFGRARVLESIPIDRPRRIQSIVRPAPPPPAISEPASPRVYTVEVSNGSTHTQTKFSSGGKQ